MIPRRILPPVLAVCLFAMALAFASAASAQQKGGESTSPANMSLAGEVDLLKGTALYDVSAGTATFTLTLREAPGTNTAESPPGVEYGGALVSVDAPCTEAGFEEAQKAGGGYPAFEAIGFSKVEPPGQPEAFSLYLTHAPSGPPTPAELGPATKSVNGTTVTLAGADTRAQNGPFTCVEIITFQMGEPNGSDLLAFPLTALPEPPSVVVPPRPTPPAAPPAPAALSFAKLKPLILKAEKWTPVRIKLTNTGGTATAPGSLKLRLPRGLKVRPVSSRQHVPAIQPGGSWTVAFRVKPTEKTKPKSTISFVGRAGGLVTRGSLPATFDG